MKRHPTKHAPDPRQRTPGPWWWESARFQAVFCAGTFFRIMSLVHTRPPAGNASRWAAF